MRSLHAITVLAFSVATASLGTGCANLLLIGGLEPSTISYEDGELRTTEEVGLDRLARACALAIEALGYDEVEKRQEALQVHWQASTASGDPVELHLESEAAEETNLRIRVGVFGDEARSRLVLEEIQQSLRKDESAEL